MFEIKTHPLVSEVIPTHNRPELVGRAVLSALSQTYTNTEVMVVVDGPDKATTDALCSVNDPRLKVVLLPERVGGAEARNIGARAARAEWIAFLDDDDEWLPEKLDAQLEKAGNSSYNFPVVASRVIARSPGADYIWPKRIFDPGEHISDYLLGRTGVFRGESFVLTSMLLSRKELLLRVPFDSGLRKGQETDWLLRAYQVPGAGLVFCEQPLLVWYFGEERASLSKTSDWGHSFQWARDRRRLMTGTAYAGFLLTNVAAMAASTMDRKAFFTLLHEAFSNGAPKIIHLVLFLGMWLFSGTARSRLRAVLQGK